MYSRKMTPVGDTKPSYEFASAFTKACVGQQARHNGTHNSKPEVDPETIPRPMRLQQ